MTCDDPRSGKGKGKHGRTAAPGVEGPVLWHEDAHQAHRHMFSGASAAQSKTATETPSAQAELAAFSSATGCPLPAQTEPEDPRYAHSAALGRRQQEWQDPSHIARVKGVAAKRPEAAKDGGGGGASGASDDAAAADLLERVWSGGDSPAAPAPAGEDAKPAGEDGKGQQGQGDDVPDEWDA